MAPTNLFLGEKKGRHGSLPLRVGQVQDLPLRMDRNYLKGIEGNYINVLLAPSTRGCLRQTKNTVKTVCTLLLVNQKQNFSGMTNYLFTVRLNSLLKLLLWSII